MEIKQNRIPWKNRLVELTLSCWFWFSLFLFSALLFPISLLIFLLTVLVDKNRRLLHFYSCIWSVIILFLNPYWKVRIYGRDYIDRKQNYVMVSNHQSGVDIIVLFRLFIHFKWVAKKELFYIPFLGWNMFLNGDIPIVRSHGRSKLMMMDRAAQVIRQGNPVMIFPEGTRTRDGKIQPFKTGAFRLALETQSPILPIAISNTYYAIRKGGLMVHKNHDITARILNPIPYESIKDMEAYEIARMVHDQIACLL